MNPNQFYTWTPSMDGKMEQSAVLYGNNYIGQTTVNGETIFGEVESGKGLKYFDPNSNSFKYASNYDVLMTYQKVTTTTLSTSSTTPMTTTSKSPTTTSTTFSTTTTQSTTTKPPLVLIGSALTSGNSITTGQAISGANGNYLTLSGGDLVYYDSAGNIIWRAGINGASSASMGSDGIFRVYDSFGNVIYSINGTPGSSLTIQNGQVVLVGSNGNVIWGSSSGYATTTTSTSTTTSTTSTTTTQAPTTTTQMTTTTSPKTCGELISDFFFN
jgi:hypothetical protein